MIFSYRRVGNQVNFPSLSPLSRKCFKLTNKLARQNENDFALVINGRLKNARKISLKITSNQSFMSAKWESLAIPSSSSPFSLIHLRFHDWILQFHTSSVVSHYHDHEHRRHREVPTKFSFPLFLQPNLPHCVIVLYVLIHHPPRRWQQCYQIPLPIYHSMLAVIKL